MKIVGEKSLATLVKYLLNIIFIGGIGIFISLPWSLKWYLIITHGVDSFKAYSFLLILLYATGVLAIAIVYEIINIFNSLDGKDPFIISNVKSLSRMGIYSFLIALFYVSKIFFFNSVATIVIIMVFIIAGFFSIILAEVFRQAVEVKQENDYTI